MALDFPDPDIMVEPEPTATATHDIVHELTIVAAPEAVFDALTAGRLVEGETADLLVGDDQLTVRVDLLERPEIVQWECVEGPREWVGTSVALRIEARPPGAAGNDSDQMVSIVRLWHGGWLYEDGLLPRASFQWAMVLDGLRKHIEG
jgi:hypothetical protein